MAGILDQYRLDGKVALVTGAGKGIGAGIAVALAEAGADVAVTARTKEDIEAVAKQVRELGRDGRRDTRRCHRPHRAAASGRRNGKCPRRIGHRGQ